VSGRTWNQQITEDFRECPGFFLGPRFSLLLSARLCQQMASEEQSDRAGIGEDNYERPPVIINPTADPAPPAVTGTSSGQSAQLHGPSPIRTRIAGLGRWLWSFFHPPNLLTFALVIFAYAQMHGQDRQVGQLTAAIEAGITKAKEALTALISENRAMLESSMEKDSSTLRTILADNREQAKRELNASMEQSRAALEAATAASRLDQRPWVTLMRFQLPEEPKVGGEITVHCIWQNTGRTPALDFITRPAVQIWGPPPIEPPKPDFSKIGPRGSTSVLPPGGGGSFFSTAKWDAAPEDLLQSYIQKKRHLFVRVLVRYNDVFGASHWTEICAYHVHGTPLDHFNFCSTGNDLDHDIGGTAQNAAAASK